MLVKNKYIVTSSSTAKLGHSYVQWLITLLSSSMFLGYGFQIGWVSPMKHFLQSNASPDSALTDIEMSFVASTATFTAIVVTPISMCIAELYGRKTTILIMMSMHALSWIIKLSSTHLAALIAARICSGFNLGGSYSIIPMYVREISQDSIRGILVSLAFSFQHVGVLIMYIMGSYLSYYTTLWIVLSISIVTLLLMMLLAPESPVFLVKKGKLDLATRTLATLRGLNIDDADVQNEMKYIKNEDTYYKTVKKLTVMAIFKNKAWRRGSIIMVIAFTCLAFNGTFGIITYAWGIMTQAGVSVSPELLSLIIPSLMMISAIVPMVCVEKIGRKPLLTAAYALSAVSLACLASALLAQQYGVQVSSWVHIVAIAVTVSVYSAGMLPMQNVILAEIFKFQVRAKLIGCIQVITWSVLSLQLVFFDLASSAWGLHSVFYACAGVNLFGTLFVIALVPETKNRTIEQIEAILTGHKNIHAAIAIASST